MDQLEGASGKCPHCSKIFSCNKLRNRHIKRVHNLVVENNRRSHILCPLCKEDNILKTYENLRKHIRECHELNIKNVTHQFSNCQDYEQWKMESRIECTYATIRSYQNKDHKEVHYVCNKGNINGYQTKYLKRREKSGGTIKMHGVCPSKLIVKFYNDGRTTVSFWETHAGHDEDEIRNQHLSSVEKNMVVQKLKAGITIDRILKDARKLESSKLERVNLLSRADVYYLSRKYNIRKRIHSNEMVAVDNNSKVEVDDPNTRNIEIEQWSNWLKKLDDEAYARVRNHFQEIMRDEDQRNKRKLEKQEYFATKKTRED